MTPGLVITRGRRLQVRQLREDDLPRMVASAFGGEEGAQHWYSQELAKGDGAGPEPRQFAVENTEGEWIGWTGFCAERDGDAGGYFFIDSSVRGRGYGTELVECVLRAMFEDCGAARCLIDYHDWNQVAARLYAKFGFVEFRRILIPEDKLTDEDRAMAPGRPVHAVIIGLTRERWREQYAP